VNEMDAGLGAERSHSMIAERGLGCVRGRILGRALVIRDAEVQRSVDATRRVHALVREWSQREGGCLVHT